MKYVCQICGKTFNNKSSLGGHIAGHSRKGKHMQLYQVICPICHKSDFEYRFTGQSNNHDSINRLCNECKIKYHDEMKIINESKQKASPYNNDLIDISVYELNFLKHMLMNKQRCEICNKIINQKTDFCIDHDHITKKTRGILCMHCNTTLGKYEIIKDKINRMNDFLIKPNDNLIAPTDISKEFKTRKVLNHYCNYCHKKLMNKRSFFCNKECMINFKKQIRNDLFNNMMINYDYHYSQKQINDIKQRDDNCYFCNRKINNNKEKFLIRYNHHIYNFIVCYSCNLIFHDIMNSIDNIKRYLNLVANNEFRDRYSNVFYESERNLNEIKNDIKHFQKYIK